MSDERGSFIHGFQILIVDGCYLNPVTRVQVYNRSMIYNWLGVRSNLSSIARHVNACRLRIVFLGDQCRRKNEIRLQVRKLRHPYVIIMTFSW